MCLLTTTLYEINILFLLLYIRIIFYFKSAAHRRFVHLDALYTLTLCFRELGNFPQALRSINNALNLDARDVKALQVQGMLYYYSGQPELAEQSYKVSRLVVPNFPPNRTR